MILKLNVQRWNEIYKIRVSRKVISMTIEFIHKENYGIALQVAKNFTSKSSMRPILQYVQHTGKGTIYATDSHCLVEVKDIHGFEEDKLIHPNSFQVATGIYPNVEKIVNDSLGASVITLDKEQIKIWLQMHKSLNQLLKKGYRHRSHVTVDLTDGVNIVIDDDNETEIRLPYGEFNPQDDIKQISYKPEIMRDCLEAHVKLNSDYIHFKIQSQLRPIVLDNEKDVKTLALPVRTF